MNYPVRRPSVAREFAVKVTPEERAAREAKARKEQETDYLAHNEHGACGCFGCQIFREQIR